MVYSKRRKNFGGGRKKRSNRSSYGSKRLRMIGGKPVALDVRICDIELLGGCKDFECQEMIEKHFLNGNDNETYYICSSLKDDKYPDYIIPKNVYTFDNAKEKYIQIGRYVGSIIYYS